MPRTTIKSRPVQQLLAASAVFLAIGGSAMAQTQAQAPAPQAAPPAAQAPMPGQGTEGHAGKHRHHGQHGHHHGGHGHGGKLWMKSVDTDGDGAVSKAEADALFARIDANKDGKLDQGEMQSYRKAQHEKVRAEMRARFDTRFKAADKDGDGALSQQEAQGGMPMLAKNFDRLDANHDGKLTRDELRAGMRQMHGHRGQRDPNAAPRNAPAAPATQGG